MHLKSAESTYFFKLTRVNLRNAAAWLAAIYFCLISTRNKLLISDRSLIERQKERLNRLATALAQEKGRLEQLNKETAILAGGVPSPSAARGLRDYVERLRDQCDMLAKRLEMAGNGE